MFGPVRSRILAVAEYLRARPVADFAAGSLFMLLIFLPFHFYVDQQDFIGVPAILTTLVVVGGAIVGGPRVGTALAILGGISYEALIVMDHWQVPGITTVLVLFLWLLAGLPLGLLGDRYRGQVARSLDQATRSRDALDRVVGATPLFHARGRPPQVARAICDIARETFDCDLCTLFAIEDDRLRLLARSPFLASSGERLNSEPSRELQQEISESLLPQFIHDVREPFAARVPRAISDDPAQVSAVRAPVVLDGQPVALLTMSWARRMEELELGELGVVQRFVEHAAVALAQAQRNQAQQDVAALYRRFQASLSPPLRIETPAVRVATYYRPGEGRMVLGGDFIDAVTRPDGSVAAVIGDVTGHGPDAAALGASLRAAWRALALGGASLEASMRTLNSMMLDESMRAEQGELGMALLATVCSVEIDVTTQRARMVNAGHPMPLFFGSEVLSLTHPPGLMLGVEQDRDWTVHKVALPDEWALLLYSDGIVEARMAPGSTERLGLERFRAAAQELWRRRAIDSSALKDLVEGIHAGHVEILDDDVTLLLLSNDGRASTRLAET